MTNIAAGAPGIGQFIAGAAATSGAGGIRGGSSAGDRGSWYEAMSRAWGQTPSSTTGVPRAKGCRTRWWLSVT